MKQTDILFPALATSLVFFCQNQSFSIKEIDEARTQLEEFERHFAADGKHNQACIRKRFALAKAYLRAGANDKAEHCFEKALGTAGIFSPSIQTRQMLKTEWQMAKELVNS